MRYLKIVLLFIVVYAITLSMYLSVKELYNQGIIKTSTYMSCFWYNLHVTQEKINGTKVTFEVENGEEIRDFYGDLLHFSFQLELDGRTIFFNMPLTMALLFSIVIVVSADALTALRALLVGVFTLILLHVVTFVVIIMSTFASVASEGRGLAHAYLNDYYLPDTLLYHLATFLNSYAVYFEPFIIGFVTYMYLKKSKANTKLI